MQRYYFDVRNDGTFVPDLSGLELDNLSAAVVAAAYVLAEMTDDIVDGSLREQLTIEIRGLPDEGMPRITLTLELAPRQ